MAELNIEKLMAAAGEKLGIPPEKLRESLNSGDLSGITENLSDEDRRKINSVLGDPKLSEKFRRMFMNGGK